MQVLGATTTLANVAGVQFQDDGAADALRLTYAEAAMAGFSLANDLVPLQLLVCLLPQHTLSFMHIIYVYPPACLMSDAVAAC